MTMTTHSAFLTALRSQTLPESTLHVLQITDSHLYQDTSRTLLGVNTFDSFNDTINIINQSDWHLDLILATGDLVHDASEKGYQRLSTTLNKFNKPVYCLPGNHDVPETMQKHLQGKNVSTPLYKDHGNWRFILLDSVIADGEGGHLANEQLSNLEHALKDAPKHVLVTLHHHPVNMNSRWMDTMTVDNADAFWEIIDRYSNVRCVLWGHVHQEFDQTRNGVRIIASPSTCIQFTPQNDDFEIDKKAPGFRLLALFDDGSIQTEVIRLSRLPAGLDESSAGY